MRRVTSVAALWLGLTALLLGASSGGASAATWQPCLTAAVALDCANFRLPLDRSGAVPGTTTVRAIRQEASEGPQLGTIFVIAGGPGQTSYVMLGLMNDYFAGANRYDIIAVDQRGSGTSQPLNCPRIESLAIDWDGADPASDKPFTACSVALGPARSAYNTAEAVADLEAVRTDLGVDNATFFGVSYGTKVALAYAKAHPNHTKALLLDSVVPTDMPGAFDVDSMAALRSALREICLGGRCRGVGADPAAGLGKLATELDRRPIESFLLNAKGKPVPAKIDASALYSIVLQADFNPFIYNQLPSTVSSALRGNSTQLERLFAIVNGTSSGSAAKKTRSTQTPKPGDRVIGRDAEDLAMFSTTMFFATTCADLSTPWGRGDDVSGRQPAIDAAAQAIPEDQFKPFSRKTVKNNSLAAFCRGWQQSTVAPAIDTGPLPDIPTLALSGTLDLRTPVTWAERAIAGDPSAQLVKIPASGHSVIGTDLSGCALSLAKRFLIFGGTDGKCKRTQPPLPIAPKVPSSLGAVRPASGSCRKLDRRACKRAKKVMTAGYLALRDAFDQAMIGGADAGPGLLGGTWSIEYDIGETLDLDVLTLAMEGLESVPGVMTFGQISLGDMPRIDSSVRIDRYRVSISGKLGSDRAADSLKLVGRSRGRSVSIRIKASKKARTAATQPTASQLSLRRSYMLASTRPRR